MGFSAEIRQGSVTKYDMMKDAPGAMPCAQARWEWGPAWDMPGVPVLVRVDGRKQDEAANSPPLRGRAECALCVRRGLPAWAQHPGKTAAFPSNTGSRPASLTLDMHQSQPNVVPHCPYFL